MAKSATFQSNQNTSVIIGTESALGTKVAADAAYLTMPVTEYSFSEVANHSLSVAPFRSGLGGMTQSAEMVKAQRHDRMYEISMTFMASPQAINRVILNLFGDASNPFQLIGSMPAVANISGSTATPVTLYFEDGASSADGTAISYKSCMCTSFQLSGDISSNGGVIMGTATFVTGFAPDNADISFSGTHTAITDQSSYFNVHDFSTTTITPSGGSVEDLVMYSFELTIQRPVNRVGHTVASSGFAPNGYIVGGYEATGSMVVKKDTESSTAITFADTVEPICEINIGDGTFQIQAPTAIIDTASINFDEDGWKTVIPFRCVYSGATTASVVDIHTA